MKEDGEARLPCRQGGLEHIVRADEACDSCSAHCVWKEHVPSSRDIRAALAFRGAKESRTGGSAEPQLHLQHVCQDCRSTFPEEMELPKVQDLEQRVDPGEPAPSGQCPKCGALCHLEAAEATASSCPTPPTIVVFVEGGVVQAVEGEAAVRVIVCDFCVTGGTLKVAGRPCHVKAWDSPEPPSSAFGEVLALLDRRDGQVANALHGGPHKERR